MAGRYAETTTVPISKSRMDIEDLLTAHGVTNFGAISSGDTSEILFELAGLRVRFRIAMPDFNDDVFKWTGKRQIRRTPAAQRKEWEQACRQRWRALYLMIRAKLEAVESGLTSLDDEFMANIMLPSGETVGDVVRPGIASAYADGEMPRFAIGAGK